MVTPLIDTPVNRRLIAVDMSTQEIQYWSGRLAERRNRPQLCRVFSE